MSGVGVVVAVVVSIIFIDLECDVPHVIGHDSALALVLLVLLLFSSPAPPPPGGGGGVSYCFYASLCSAVKCQCYKPTFMPSL